MLIFVNFNFCSVTYEKKDRANINKTELSALKTIAADLLIYSDDELNKAVTDNKLEELFYK